MGYQLNSWHQTLPNKAHSSCNTMMRAVQITKFGGPDVLEVVQKEIPTAGPNVLIKVVCAGVNVS